jgi:putative ABC transport system permease protein
MGFLETVRFALRALVVNRLRSLLTMLGIIIGIAAVILLTSVGQGAAQFIQGQITGLGATSISVFQRTPPPAAGTEARNLTEDDARALDDRQGAPSITSVSPVVTLSPNTTAGRATSSATLFGSDENYFAGANAKVVAGRPYDASDVARSAKVVVIGRTVADDLYGVNADPIGREVQFDRVPFTVIGLLETQGQGGPGGNQDEQALAPITTLQGTLTGYDNLERIIVQTRTIEDQPAAQAQIELILDRRHGITNPDYRDYRVFSSQQIANTLNSVFGVLTLLLAAIAGISLLVGGIGITNIMLVSVTERTREIGIRKALGAPPSAILGQFLVESVVLSLTGGAIGVLIGVGATFIPLGDFVPVVVPWAVAAAVGVSAAIGVFFGTFPARRAANLRPIEALRRE